MKILITGANGFVGRYLCKRLGELSQEVIGIDRQKAAAPLAGAAAAYACDMTSLAALCDIMRTVVPDAIVHLAAESSVAFSWEHPAESILNNAQIFANLLEAIRTKAPGARLLSVGSSEQYGIVDSSMIPLRETMPSRPVSPYAVARTMQEHLSLVYSSGYGTDIVCTRSFNHIGAGQDERFVIPHFVRQACDIKAGRRQFFECGDIEVIRDFMDVRDVVDAYVHLIHHGKSGEVYNICTGTGRTLQSVIGMLEEMLGCGLPLRRKEGLLRPVENPIVIGDNAKLRSLGFDLRHEFTESLQAIVAYYDHLWNEEQ